MGTYVACLLPAGCVCRVFAELPAPQLVLIKGVLTAGFSFPTNWGVEASIHRVSGGANPCEAFCIPDSI